MHNHSRNHTIHWVCWSFHDFPCKLHHGSPWELHQHNDVQLFWIVSKLGVINIHMPPFYFHQTQIKWMVYLVCWNFRFPLLMAVPSLRNWWWQEIIWRVLDQRMMGDQADWFAVLVCSVPCLNASRCCANNGDGFQKIKFTEPALKKNKTGARKKCHSGWSQVNLPHVMARKQGGSLKKRGNHQMGVHINSISFRVHLRANPSEMLQQTNTQPVERWSINMSKYYRSSSGPLGSSATRDLWFVEKIFTSVEALRSSRL